MPVAEDLDAAPRERRLSLWRDGIGNGAAAHEHRLLSAARPALPVLNWLGAIVDLLLGDGRPYRIVSRRYGRNVLIPAYASLVVQKE